MKDLISVRAKVNEMGELALSMLRTTFDGFIKHDREILAGVLKNEQRLNEMEQAINLALIEIAKGKITAGAEKKMVFLTNIVADLEEIGDYVKDMIERIEIKIDEKLLFTEDAVVEYKHLYGVVEASLASIVNSLKLNNANFAEMVLCGKENVDRLIIKYRNAHAKRLIADQCDPRSGNMFLNLLDFTGQIFHHTKAIARSIAGLK
jgi:phosphate:Na+ symporter